MESINLRFMIENKYTRMKKIVMYQLKEKKLILNLIFTSIINHAIV